MGESALYLLFLIILLATLWYHSRRIHEKAVSYCKQACLNHHVQLLDDTVSLSRISVGHNQAGKLVLCRVFGFDYTTNSVTRQQGYLIMHGDQMKILHLENQTLH